jgi:orotidine-5'-phosphate decarboxylase
MLHRANFADRLSQRILETRNPTVLGLDPLLDYIPASILDYFRRECDDAAMASGLAIYEFNRRLIDSVSDIIPAIKPQSAYYEQYGVAGITALRQTIQFASKSGMLVIADCKRNDIGSTAEAYAKAYLDETTLIDGGCMAMFGADAMTVNGYLGSDGIAPFVEACQANGRGIFVLVRTSNTSAGDFQDLVLSDGRPVYEAMAGKVAEWGAALIGTSGYSSVGAVVGATWPLQAARLRKMMPHAFILVPGYGAQGATADDAANSFGPDGGGAIVNASRSLMLAWKKHQMDHESFDLAARREALLMKADLQRALEKSGRPIQPIQ